MRNFAIAKSSPWSIAWLVQANDWNHLERIIHHNCTLLGGCNNIVIPVSEDGMIWDGFELFMALYDADFIVLAPEMSNLSLQTESLPLNPFGVVEWNQAPQIISPNNLGWTTGQAAQVRSHHSILRQDPSAHDLVAVSDPSLVDASRLALMACGDVIPAELEPDEFNGTVYFHAHGYRESILERSAMEGRQAEVSARVGDNDDFINAPTRDELVSIIRDENKFPLTGTAAILEACASLQHLTMGRLSFINRTSTHRGSGTPGRRFSHLFQIPGMAILISDNFGFHEAILFWNLRANQVVTSWLSFSQLEHETDEIREWLDSDFGASFYTYGSDVAFAAAEQDRDRLEQAFSRLVASRKREYPEWKTSSYHNLTLYDCERPHLQSKHVSVTQDGDDCSFLPDYPLESYGAIATTLEWPTLMLPRRPAVASLVSSERIQCWPRWQPPSKQIVRPLDTPRFRITDTRHARLQFGDSSPVNFVVPSLHHILQKLFEEAGFARFEESSHAQYQNAFIKRCGSLLQACHLLRTTPSREFLQLMSDCKQSPTRLGWLVNKPERRALNQAAIWQALDQTLPERTDDYLKNAEALPEEAAPLLKHQLLERGFQLKCSFCSAKMWYRAEDVGQAFRCQRCYEEQRVQSNPVWLYKLPEVVFQFLNNDAEVPLLALFHLLLMSTKNFQYVLDSDVFRGANDKHGKNIDFSCLTDGKVYLGEAKSNGVIEAGQFEFYENLIRRAAIDGVVFATTESNWNPSTLSRIENLKTEFKGNVLVLNKSQLLDNRIE